MENGVISPGVKQSFTWSTPFFDVTFVDIKSKRGMTNITYVMQDFGFGMSSKHTLNIPTIPSQFSLDWAQMCQMCHMVLVVKEIRALLVLCPDSGLSLTPDDGSIVSCTWHLTRSHLRYPVYYEEHRRYYPQPKDSTMPLSRCGHSWPHSSISPHSSTHSISDSHRRHNPPHSTSQSRKDLCVSSENMDMEAGIFGPNSYPIEHLIILIEKNLES